MKAPDILYECPQTVAEAVALLSDDGRFCQPLAGGQSLMPMMHLRLAQPEVLIDLNALAELDFIEQVDDTIHVGSMVRYTTLLNSELIRRHVPLMSLSLPHVAHSAVRNRGTIGGSTALADPAAEMPAVLKALNAVIVAVSQSGPREISADDFFQGIYETALGDDELVHSIKFPAATDQQRFGFYELARRHGDYAMAGVAVSAQSINPYTGLRIIFFGVADQPLRATGAEAALEGSMFKDEPAILEAQNALPADEFTGDVGVSVDTKVQLAKVVLKRALLAM